jgi:hypothetical protein
MRQLSRMCRHWLICIVAIALSACSGLPAPYQTYSPSDVAAPNSPDNAAAPSPPANALVVYGATTSTPDMAPDSSEPEPVPSPDTSAPTSNPEPAATPSSQQVAICYNRLWNKPEAIKNAAVRACGNSAARLESQRIDLNACPLLTPTKAVFVCSAAANP